MARLIVFSGRERLRECALRPQDVELLIGRGPECDLRLDDDSVSLSHAIVRRVDGGWQLIDLDSTNGSYVGDERVQRTRLQDGDVIRLARTTMKYLDGCGVESQYHAELQRRSERDPATGTYNRRFAMGVLAGALRGQSVKDEPVTVALLDIDDFKQLNDEHGHVAGDIALKAVADILVLEATPDDVVARYGGEEFVIVFRSGGLDRARRCAERMREAIARHGVLVADGEEELVVTVSVGLASAAAGPDTTAQGLLADADRNLYEAKRRGKNLVVG